MDAVPNRPPETVFRNFGGSSFAART